MNRILHVNKFAHVVGGVETHISQLMAQQATQGHDVDLFSSADVAGEGFDPSASDFRGKVSSAATLLWSRGARATLAARAAEFRPNVIHYHSVYHHLSPSVLGCAHRVGAAAVMTLHDYKLAAPCYVLFRDGHECTLCVGRTLPIDAVRYRCVKGSLPGSVTCAIEQSLHKNVYRHAIDAFVAPSEAAAHYLAASAAVDAARLHVAPHGVAVPREPAELADDPPQLWCLGRLSAEKGIWNLIEAWAAASLPAPWELVVAGDGAERGALEQRARGLRVRFIGHLDWPTLATALRKASVVAVPSLVPETFGLSAAEAMALGIPVLVSDVGNLPNLVGDPAQVLPAHDVDTWSAAIRSMATSRQRRVDLGLAGRRRISQLFDPASAAARLDEIYSAARRSPSIAPAA